MSGRLPISVACARTPLAAPKTSSHGFVLTSSLQSKVQCAEAPESTVPAATGSVEIAREISPLVLGSLKLATEHASMRRAEL